MEVRITIVAAIHPVVSDKSSEVIEIHWKDVPDRDV
jgi:hypothetical protein